MTPKRAHKRRAASGGAPPTGRPTASQQRPTGKAAGRVPARPGAGGAGSSDLGSLLLWSAVFGIVAIFVVGAAFAFTQLKSAAPIGSPIPPTAITPASIESNGRTLGSSGSPVTIDVYGDFRCSACFAFTTGGTEASLVDGYISPGKAKLVWHDLLSIDHLRGGTASRDAANAAWCAADQGKFWVMHDWLFANDEFPTEDPAAFTLTRLAAIGKAAGLDMSRLQPCLDQGTHNAAIAAEDASTPAQATGTPSIFVNGKFVQGSTADSVPTNAQIKTAIDAALASSSPSASPGATNSAAPSATPTS